MPKIPTGGLEAAGIRGGQPQERGRKTSVQLPGTSAVRVDTGRGGGDPSVIGRALAQVGGDIVQAASTVASIRERNIAEKRSIAVRDKQTEYWNLTRETRARLEAQQGANADGLNDQLDLGFNEVLSEWLDGVDDPEIKAELEQFDATRRSIEKDTLTKIELRERENTRVASVDAFKTAKVNDMILPGTTIGDVVEAHRDLNQADLSDPFLDTEEKRDIQSKVNGSALYGAFFEKLLKGEAEEAVQVFDANKDDLSETMSAKGFNSLQRGVEGARRGLERDKTVLANEIKRDNLAAIERERTRTEVDLIRRISDAEINGSSLVGINSELGGLHSAGKISNSTFKSSSRKIITIEASRQNLLQDRLELERRIEIKAPIDSKRFKKAIDARFEAKRNSWGERSDPVQTVNFIRETRAIPSVLKGEASAALRTGTTKNVIDAVMFMEVLRQDREASPSLASFSKGERAFAGQVASMVGAGTSPDRAVEIQRKNQYELTEADRILIKNVTRGAEFKKKNLEFLNDSSEAEFDPWSPFIGEPDLSDMIQAEFNILAEDYAVFTDGNMESARNLAWSDLKQVYSVSEVNGTRELMKYAPDAAYAGLSSGDIRNQFVADIEGLGIDADNARIATDPTVIQGWPNPTYPVLITSPNGEINALLDELGRVQRWSPSLGREELEAKQ